MKHHQVGPPWPTYREIPIIKFDLLSFPNGIVLSHFHPDQKVEPTGLRNATGLLFDATATSFSPPLRRRTSTFNL
ncbi:MAG: hypothetical protein M0Z50_04290 [Planctomycetia bacterium]|nr:hypothetical protein [Planctomycetia bacterium]